MVDDRNIDKWDFEQIFPPIAKGKCPYCASGKIYDARTFLAKLLCFPLAIWFNKTAFYDPKKGKLLTFRRRKCAECGFEYSVEQTEPVLIVIGAAAALTAVVALIVSMCSGA